MVGFVLTARHANSVELVRTAHPKLEDFRMNCNRWLFAAVCWLVLIQSGKPLIAQELKASQVERLEGLCRLWGSVKYVHPHLAYRDIDWDKALVETIPKVEAASSAEEYAGAIDHLLSFLDDPQTRRINLSQMRVGREKESEDRDLLGDKSGQRQPYMKTLDDGAALVVANDYSQVAKVRRDQMRALLEECIGAESVIFDLRHKHGRSGFATPHRILQDIGILLADDLTLATTRSRLHNSHTLSGWLPAYGGNGYFSGMLNKEHQVWKSAEMTKSPKPLVFVINSGTWGLSMFLGGLQSAGIGTVIQEGDPPDRGFKSTFGEHVFELPGNIWVHVPQEEIVNPDGSIGWEPDYIIAAPDGDKPAEDSALQLARAVLRGQAPEARKRPNPAYVPHSPRRERPYSDMELPSREYRLLALFRYWNVIDRFFPYKQLMDHSWDDVLTETIPRIAAANDRKEYEYTIAELLSRIQDSHASGFGGQVLRRHRGNHRPLLRVRSLSKTTVVTAVADSVQAESGLKVGDVITAIDGEPIVQLRNRLGRYISASTPQALRRDVDSLLLRGKVDSSVTLTVHNAPGERRDVVVKRLPTSQRRPRNQMTKPAVVAQLPEGYCYIDLDRFTQGDAAAARKVLEESPGVIFDMRGYPRGGLMALLGTGSGERVPTAQFRFPLHMSPSLQSHNGGLQRMPLDLSPLSKKTTVVLIDESAQSSAEHVCLELESVATFVGTPTVGTDGVVVSMSLPGGLQTHFTGMEFRHADGRQLQRVGIQPDIRVEPTVEGIRADRDEVLEAAIRYLRSSAK